MSRSPLQLCLCPQPFGHAKCEFKPPYYFCLLGPQFPAGTLPLLTLSAQGCSQGWREKRGPVTVLGTQAVPAMWQKEQGEAEKLIVGQVLGYQPAFAMLMLTSPRHCEVNCSVPAHPACTWPSFWAALPAGKPPCLTTRIKGSPSSTCALGWHGRGCQLAGQPLLVTGGTLSLNHPGHPYSVHLAPCPSHLELPLSSISDHLVQLSLVLC